MKILVYGAGVLGSQLAHVLHSSGNEVSLLARGNRLVELHEHDLVIRHYIQMKTTFDRLNLVERLAPEDSFDLCFVVMQRQQLDEVLPDISASTGCQNFVLVGNNSTAEETAEFIHSHSPMQKNIAFGFQASGGRREAGRVIGIHMGLSDLGGNMTVGSLDGNRALYGLIHKAFADSKYHMTICESMDGWLKCHAAFVLPIAFACYFADGDLRKVAWNKQMMNLMIDAIDDAYRIVKAAGYPIVPPEDDGFLQKSRTKYYWMLKFMMATPIGKLAASDHAMSARSEMRRLYDDFCILKQKAGIDTPAWDEMAKYMEKC